MNKEHPVFHVDENNLHIIYQEKLGVLQLEECKVLEDSWIRLRYKVCKCQPFGEGR